MAKSYHPNLDSVTTIREDGSRRYLHPSDARGRFQTARRASAVGLIAVYLLMPWVHVGGYPAVFLDVADRRFHLFGLTLAVQDMWLLFFLITGLGFSLFLITALLGRIWCGWACPQTIFLDHVFRRIERWTEGDAVNRRRLQAAPVSLDKVIRRTSKHALYVVAAAAITHLFLAYFVSLPQLWSMMRAAPTDNWSAFVFIAIATGILYFNFAWFREQLCIVICPYGRLQSALVDDNTLVIGYDARRGEPRGALSGHPAPGPSGAAPARETGGAGDCVACTRCVQVCPTGIDIRDGLQLECIGCAACVDACDEVMARIGRAPGLVRYDSAAGFAGRRTRWMRPRIGLYAGLLLAGLLAASWALSSLHRANFGITRMIGTPYIVDRGSVRNQFLVRLINKRTEPVRFLVSVRGGPSGFVRQSGCEGAIQVEGQGEVVEPLILEVPLGSFTADFNVRVTVSDEGGHLTLVHDVDFLGPQPGVMEGTTR